MLVGLSDVGGRVPRGPYKTHWATLIFCLVAFSFFLKRAPSPTRLFMRKRMRPNTCIRVINTDINSQVPWHSNHCLHASSDDIYTPWIANTHPVPLPPLQWTSLATTRGHTRTASPSRRSNTHPTDHPRRIASNTLPPALLSPSLHSMTNITNITNTINIINIHITLIHLRNDSRPCARKSRRSNSPPSNRAAACPTSLVGNLLRRGRCARLDSAATPQKNTANK